MIVGRVGVRSHAGRIVAVEGELIFSTKHKVYHVNTELKSADDLKSPQMR
jgi:hypothetical protein